MFTVPIVTNHDYSSNTYCNYFTDHNNYIYRLKVILAALIAVSCKLTFNYIFEIWRKTNQNNCQNIPYNKKFKFDNKWISAKKK